MMEKIDLVFSRAHWDIEWYPPFQAYRFRRVKILDRLIDLCEIKNFCLIVI